MVVLCHDERFSCVKLIIDLTLPRLKPVGFFSLRGDLLRQDYSSQSSGHLSRSVSYIECNGFEVPLHTDSFSQNVKSGILISV